MVNKEEGKSFFFFIKSYLRTPKRKHNAVSRENMYGYRELSADVTCSKMQTNVISNVISMAIQ